MFFKSRFYFVFFLAFLHHFHLYAQLSIKTDRDDAFYEKGETAYFQILSDSSSTANYSIQYGNNTSPIVSGTLTLVAGQPQQVPYSHNMPGIVACNIVQNDRSATTTAVFSPYEIKPVEDEPADFDQFWKNQKALLEAVPIDPQLSLIADDGEISTYKISLANIENRRVYGYLCVPNGPGVFPAVLSLPPFGIGVNLVQPDDFLCRNAKVITFAMTIHNAAPDEQDSLAYLPNNIFNRDSIYYRYVVLGMQRAVDYLYSMPEFDKINLGVNGVSQGGGLAIMIAGLDQRVSLMIQSNAGLCEHAALKYGRESGFPYYIKGFFNQDSVLSAVKYYDAVFFAKRYKGPSLNIISYRDNICPPASVFAAFNQLSGPKTLLHALRLGHDQPNEYWSGRLPYYHHYFNTPNFPVQGLAALVADAGESRFVAMMGDTVHLSARTFKDQVEVTGLEVGWETGLCGEKGRFLNNQTYHTVYTLDSTGDHEIRFWANEKNKLPLENKYYTFFDEIKLKIGDLGAITPNTCSNSGSTSFPQHIKSIKIGNIHHVSGQTGYSDFTKYFTEILPGSTQQILLMPAVSGQPDPAHWQVWIDYNRDGDFLDNGESVFQIKSNQTVKSTITIPQNIVPGNIRMRVSLKSDSYTTSCNPFGQGEVEDYTLVIKEVQPACLAGLQPENTATYCASNAEFPWNEWIERIQLADLDHQSDKSPYSNFRSYMAHVIAGQNYTMSLTAGTSWATHPEYWQIWVDFNDDKVFDPNELLVSSQTDVPISGSQIFTHVVDMSIPQDVGAGAYRMRISMSRNESPAPCGVFEYGEVEDYTLVVSEDTSQTVTCAINALTTNVQCLEDTADTFSFSVLVNGTNTGSIWTATLGNSIFLSGEYGQAVTSNAAISAGGFLMTVSDAATSGCQTTVQVTAPEPCYAAPCSLFVAVANIQCQMDNPDTYRFDLLTFGAGTVTNWVMEANNQVYNGEYGLTTSINGFSISQGNQIIVVRDSSRASCFSTYTIQAPDPCYDNSDYCSVAADSSRYEWIKHVSWGNLSNNSGANGYSNFTYLMDTLSSNLQQSLTVKPGFWVQKSKENWSVWIDLNQDSIFDPINELVAEGSTSVLDTSLTMNIAIPSHAQSGMTRMRVSMIRDNVGVASPCNNFEYGEVEDYSVYLNVVNSIGAPNLSQQTILVNPNPASDWINISAFLGGISTVQSILLYNSLGQVITEIPNFTAINDKLVQLSVQHLPAGIYSLCLVMNNHSKQTARFVKQ